MSSVSRSDYNGLAHLMEAATALTELTETMKSKLDTSTRPTVIRDDCQNKPTDSNMSKKKDIFPHKLMEILCDPDLSNIVTWLPHGRSFVMIRPDMFTEHVLPKYMPAIDSRASTKYPSFTRKLNRWGFRQATRGPDAGAFHHELFRRDQPELCLEMVCQKSREKQATRRTLPAKKGLYATGEERVVSDSSNASSVSSDENSSVCSGIQDNDDSHHSKPPTSIVSGTANGSEVPLQFISNDVKFVSDTLLERDRKEVLKAARAMLYDAYLKASEESKHL